VFFLRESEKSKITTALRGVFFFLNGLLPVLILFFNLTSWTVSIFLYRSCLIILLSFMLFSLAPQAACFLAVSGLGRLIIAGAQRGRASQWVL